MTRPTGRQLEVLALVARGVTARRDLAEALGRRSTNGAEDHVKALERRGLVVRKRGKRQGNLSITAAGIETLGPCTCLVKPIAHGQVRHDPAAGGYVVAGLGRALVFCPWCGTRLQPETPCSTTD